VRRWLSQLGEHADDLLRLPLAPPALRKLVESIRAARDPLRLGDLAVNGDDLLSAGVRPGPEIGTTLHQLLDQVLEDPRRNTKEYLLKHAMSARDQ
jgi:tRNA nucleotidyltransferase (CCA-adding enzyme)